MGKDSPEPPSHNSLLKQDLPRVIAGQVEQGYFLVISLLIPRILSVLNDNQSFLHVNQWPLGFADLFLTQCRCDGKSDDPPHRYESPTVRLKVFDEFIEFVLCRPSVTLFAPSN